MPRPYLSTIKNNFQFPIFLVIGVFVIMVFMVNTAFALTGSFVPGKFGSAYNFQAKDNIDAGNVYNGVRTVSFWVKLNSSTEKILELNTTTYVEASAGVVSASGFTSPVIYVNGVQTTAISAGAWQFVAVTTGTDINASAVSLGLVGAASLNGVLDDVKFYNYARTQKQIYEDMLGGAPPLRREGAVLHLDFNEGYGTTAFDKSNNNNDLTLSTASWTLNGKFGQAFDGADNKRITRADDADFDFAAASDFSISSWFKSDSASNPAATQYILSKHASGLGYAIYTDTNGYLNFGIDDDTASFPEDYAQAAADFYDNTWHLLTAVKTGTSKIELYIDGILKGSDVALSASGTLENTGKLILGDYNETDGTDEFIGDIDENKIYRFALSPAEIKQEYNRASSLELGVSRNANSTWDDGGFGGVAPVAWWKMDEKTGQYAYDVSDNENTGTLGSTTGSDANDPTWKSAGSCKKGSCLSFDGGDDYVSGNGIDFGTGNFTIGLWARYSNLTTSGASQALTGSGTSSYWALYKNTSHRFAWHSTSGTNRANSITTVAVNTRYYVVLVRSGSIVYMYVNGILENSASESGNLSYGGSHYIGCDPALTYRHNGLIDDVRIYNYARTPGQIAWDYNRGKPKLHWKFDENTGTTAYDYAKTKNGTITGPDWTGGADQCKFNYCLDFIPANSDYVDIGNTGIGTNLQAVSFWIYPDSVASQSLMDFDAGTHKIITDASGNLTATGWSSPTYYINGRPQGSPLQTGQWQHIAITTATAFSPSDVDFGRVATSYFDGKLDEIKFYTYPLTASQVKMDYQGGALRIGPSEGLP